MRWFPPQTPNRTYFPVFRLQGEFAKILAINSLECQAGISRLVVSALARTHPRSAAVLVDEFDAGNWVRFDGETGAS
jgi:hypothetical protein